MTLTSPALVAAVRVSSPRFDSVGQAALNVIGIALWVTVLVLVVRRHRAGRGSGWGVVALLVNVSISGVYVPIGPLLWLATSAPR